MIIRFNTGLIFQIFSLFIFLLSCEETVIKSEPDAAKSEEREGKIFITDLRNYEWDITAAIEIYGMEKHKFKAGLGAGYIPPITNPIFIGPDSPDYPDDSEDFIMLGLHLREIKHAYTLEDMSRHEVVDDVFLDQYVAVAY